MHLTSSLYPQRESFGNLWGAVTLLTAIPLGWQDTQSMRWMEILSSFWPQSHWSGYLEVVLFYFQKLKSQVKKETGWHIWCLRSDGGKAYFSNEFISYLQGEHIRKEFSCQNTPQQNGIAEKKNRQILEVACAMMHEKHMPNFCWAKEASTAFYFMNQCTTNGMHELTPYELLVERKPILSHLKVFRSIGNVHISNENQQKPDVKLEKISS